MPRSWGTGWDRYDRYRAANRFKKGSPRAKKTWSRKTRHAPISGYDVARRMRRRYGR